MVFQCEEISITRLCFLFVFVGDESMVMSIVFQSQEVWLIVPIDFIVLRTNELI